jgi:hypothetical protein
VDTYIHATGSGSIIRVLRILVNQTAVHHGDEYRFGLLEVCRTAERLLLIFFAN